MGKSNLKFLGCSIDDATSYLFFMNDLDKCIYYSGMDGVNMIGPFEKNCDKIQENMFRYSSQDEELTNSYWTFTYDNDLDRITVKGYIDFEVPEMMSIQPDGSFDLEPLYSPEDDVRFGVKEYTINNISQKACKLQSIDIDLFDPLKTKFEKTRKKFSFLANL